MWIIFGWGRKSKPLYYLGLKQCQREGSIQHYYVYRTYQHFSLFFLPIIQWNVKYFIACAHCGSAMEIEKSQLPKCEELSNRLFSHNKVNEMMAYLRNQYRMMGLDTHTKEDLMERITHQYNIENHEKEVEHMIEAILEEKTNQHNFNLNI